ncbi:hypothetical protein PHYPSEUDO_006044 [Phytophthora pseudosyringae]|uniref:Uncharacterized protein n=1 Tax=Phytophthora pseudosyringae TaxID=221518 RepID=A0A8T1VKG6_9STRA|nr:hypothetical protein PHYPSEUDO_006044 [Phytophthora pseudosyringae]
MELLVADIRRQLDGEWALLGPTAASFLMDWGDGGKLRLPRTEDSLFGVSFPLIELKQEQRDDEDDGDVAAAPEREDEEVVGLDSKHGEQEATDGSSSPAKAAPLESSSLLGDALEPADAGQAVGAQASQGSHVEAVEAVAAHGIRSDTSRRVSAVEIRGTTLQAETSAGGAKQQQLEQQAENMDGALLQRGKDGSSQLASVQRILATHSRADILLELEWARQALRDRRKLVDHPQGMWPDRLSIVSCFLQYLRSKGLVKRGSEPCACP